MKKTLLLLSIILTAIQAGICSVSLRVCGPNEVVAFDPNTNIMVGQKLTFIVSSDPNDYWHGGLYVEGNDRALGILSARDSDPNLRDFTDAHYPSAGDDAVVWSWRDSDTWGFEMHSSDGNSVPGDWFVIDYIAKQSGPCKIKFYDYSTSWSDPSLSIGLDQDPSCDFNEDGIVNLLDFSKLSTYWLADCDNCADQNDCLAVDLDFDRTIDSNDLRIFARHWMWDGSISQPGIQSNSTPDPNLIYSIVDENGLDEIYLNVGESTRLYVDLNTIDQNDLVSFNFDVHISDPNYGSIINIPDPNIVNPNDMPQILALPRNTLFDLIKPGALQPEGIQFSAIHITLDPNYPCINDGHLASFIYTATDANDIELNIVNHSSQRRSNQYAYPTVKSIIIHQTNTLELPEGESSTMMSVPVAMTTSSDDLTTTSETATNDVKMIDFLQNVYNQNEDLQNNMNESEWQEFIENIQRIFEQSY